MGGLLKGFGQLAGFVVGDKDGASIPALARMSSRFTFLLQWKYLPGGKIFSENTKSPKGLPAYTCKENVETSILSYLDGKIVRQ